MVKTEKVNIEGKEYYLKCSLATTEYYQRITGDKFSSALSSIAKMRSGMMPDDTESVMDSVLEMQNNTMKMAYAMIIEAQKDGHNEGFHMTLDDWLSSIGALDGEAIGGVLAVAMSVFPRKVPESDGE